MGMYCHFIHFLLNNLKIVHFCYFQNTFPFVSTLRQTDDIRKKTSKKFRGTGYGMPNDRDLSDFVTQHVRLKSYYTLFHEKISTVFFNKISLPERRNKRKSVLEITKMYYFLI